MAHTVNERDAPERSTAELVKTAAEQISRLVRDELRLAQAELARKGKHAGLGAGLFGAGGLLALYGVAALLTAVVLLLAYVMPAWLAALVVAVVLLGIAGVLAMVGRKQVQQGTPPVPEEAVRSVKADIDALTDAVKRGHR
jgi:Flp pilus assembly protein TadB